MNRMLIRAAGTALLILMLAVSGALAGEPDGNPDPAPDPGPTGQEVAATAQKQQLVHDWLAARAGRLAASVVRAEVAAFQGVSTHIPDSTVVPNAVSGVLGVSQYAQVNSIYCGPSAVYSILKYKNALTGPAGESLTQSHLGAKCTSGYLCTDYDGGTSWYHSAAYPRPVVSTLNAWMNTTWYMAQSGATSYNGRLVFDIDNLRPIALNIYEKASTSTPHLKGHPTNHEIWHWIVASGYDGSGASTYYLEPAYGSGVWPNVPQYAWVSNSTTAGLGYMLATRGYVW